MLKYSLFFALLISLMFISNSSSFASSVPDKVRTAIERDWQNQQQSISIFLNQEQPEQALHTDYNDKNVLGDGYAIYSLKNLATVQNDAYTANVLQFSGYVFNVEDQNGSKALAYAKQPPHYDTITHLASDPNFSDQSFKIPLEQAKQKIGYTSESKLINDEPHHIIALVTAKDGLEQLIFIEDSMLLNMKKFDIISFEEFMIKIRQADAIQAKFASNSTEPLSGAGVSYDRENTQKSSFITADWNIVSYSLIWKIGLIMIIIVATICYLTYCKSKHHR